MCPVGRMGLEENKAKKRNQKKADDTLEWGNLERV